MYIASWHQWVYCQNMSFTHHHDIEHINKSNALKVDVVLYSILCESEMRHYYQVGNFATTVVLPYNDIRLTYQFCYDISIRCRKTTLG